MKSMHVSADPDTLFAKMDKDASGTVDFDEFVAYLKELMRDLALSPRDWLEAMSSLKMSVSKYADKAGTINEVMNSKRGEIQQL